jgi:hypothetical protein
MGVRDRNSVERGGKEGVTDINTRSDPVEAEEAGWTRGDGGDERLKDKRIRGKRLRKIDVRGHER